jgi:hypothetical protein
MPTTATKLPTGDHWCSSASETGELVTLAENKKPAVVCIGALPPDRLARTHCRRLPARPPNAKIVVGRCGLNTAVEQNREQFQESGTDQMEKKLLEIQS